MLDLPLPEQRSLLEERLVDLIIDQPVRLLGLPAASFTRAQKAKALQNLQATRARLAAQEVELILALAEDSRTDSPDGEVGEFFVDELALVLHCSRASATSLYGQARTLAERLPATLAALRSGGLDWPRARAIADELGEPADDTDPAIIAEVEAAVLAEAADLSIRRLREKVRGELAARDAAASERRRRLAEQAVNVTARATGDGMGELVSGHRLDRAAAMFDAIDRYAWMRKKDGDDRPINVIRAEVHEALVLRPWQNFPAVTARLDLAASLGALRPDVPVPGRAAPTATVHGMPITAAHLRRLLGELSAYGLAAPVGGELHLALVDVNGRLRATLTPAELAGLARKGCPEHPDADAGAMGGCSCAVLDMPPPTTRYRPTPAQRRFVSTRDRTCRWPGCGNPAGWADHDHVVPHADGGETDCRNLCCLCRHHHQVKTKDRSWRFVLDDDGTLHVTTPSGVTRSTRPPGLDPPDPVDDVPPF